MKANVIIHRDFAVAAVDPRIYGVHLGSPGSADHAAICDPGHSAADESGLRTDVLDLVRAFQLPCMLGATAAAGVEARDGRLNQQIRVDGLVDWCRRSGAEPMLSLALGDVDDRRRSLGIGERHGVRMWHLGYSGDDLADDPFDAVLSRLRSGDPGATLVLGAGAADTDRALRLLDRHRHGLDLVSLPSASPGPSTAAEMEAAIDALSLRLDRSGISDRCGRPIGIQVDRWDSLDGAPADRAFDRALAMNVLIRRADRIRTAFAGNVIAGIADILDEMVGMGHRSDLYDPLLAGSIYGRGTSLMPVVRSTEFETADGEILQALDVAVVFDEERQSLSLFVANRADAPKTMTADLHGFGSFTVAEHRIGSPTIRMPGSRSAAPAIEHGRLTWTLPARSYALAKLVRLQS